MQMEHGLSSARPDIHDRAVTVFDPTIASNARGSEVAESDQIRVFRRGLFQIDNMFLGNDEHMSRALRVDVFEGKEMIVFIDLLAGYFAANDTAE
jgi:hypothetical protein